MGEKGEQYGLKDKSLPCVTLNTWFANQHWQVPFPPFPCLQHVDTHLLQGMDEKYYI